MNELFYYSMEDIKFRAKYEKVVELLDKLKSDGATLLEVANGLRLVGGFKKRLTFSQRLHLKDYPFYHMIFPNLVDMTCENRLEKYVCIAINSEVMYNGFYHEH